MASPRIFKHTTHRPFPVPLHNVTPVLPQAARLLTNLTRHCSGCLTSLHRPSTPSPDTHLCCLQTYLIEGSGALQRLPPHPSTAPQPCPRPLTPAACRRTSFAALQPSGSCLHIPRFLSTLPPPIHPCCLQTYLIDGTPALQVTEHVATRARRTSYVIPAEPLMLPLADPPVPLYTGPHMAAFASEPGMQLRAGTLNPQRAQLNLAPSPSCTYSFEADSPGAGPRSQGLEGCMSAGLTSITTSTSYGDSAGAVARFTPSFSLLQAPSGRTSSGQMGSFHVTLPCPPKVAAPPVLRKLSENRISTGGVVMNAGGDAPQAASAAAGTPGTSQASGSTASGVRPDTV